MLASEEIQQLQKLRQLHMAQMQSANAYMAYEVNKDSATNASLNEFINVIEYNGGGERY
jgi:P-type conjugative transfer protein TrbJ